MVNVLFLPIGLLLGILWGRSLLLPIGLLLDTLWGRRVRFGFLLGWR